MAARDSSGVERRRARLDGNRPRTHPKRSGRKAAKPHATSTGPGEGPEVIDVLEQLSRSIALVETIAVAMQTHEARYRAGLHRDKSRPRLLPAPAGPRRRRSRAQSGDYVSASLRDGCNDEEVKMALAVTCDLIDATAGELEAIGGKGRGS